MKSEKYMCQRLETLGRIREKLHQLEMSDLIPDDLSKHNPYFHSEHEAESNKLYDIRCKFSGIREAISEIWEVLLSDEHREE